MQEITEYGLTLNAYMIQENHTVSASQISSHKTIISQVWLNGWV